jgi:hypothetical protein
MTFAISVRPEIGFAGGVDATGASGLATEA